MKKLLLLSAFLFIAQFSMAQISQGYKYLSGTVMYDTYRSDDVRINEVTVMPEFNYMAADYFSIGVAAGVVQQKTVNDALNSKNTLNLYGFAPKIKFFSPVGDNVYLSPEVSVPLMFGEYEVSGQNDNVTTYDNTRWGFNSGLGVVFVLGERFSVEAKMGIINYEVDIRKLGSDETVVENFNFGFDFENSGLAVSYFF